MAGCLLLSVAGLVLLVLQMTYEIMGDRAEEHHGNWYPTIVTTAMDSEGNHTVTEYWSSEVEE